MDTFLLAVVHFGQIRFSQTGSSLLNSLSHRRQVRLVFSLIIHFPYRFNDYLFEVVELLYVCFVLCFTEIADGFSLD